MSSATAESPIARKAPWESPWESEDAPLAESAAPHRGKLAVQHTEDQPRGRRSRRFPDLHLAQCANRLGVSKSHLIRVLNGTTRPSLKLAQDLARLLDRSIDYIIALYNTESTPPKKAVKPKRKKK